MKPPLVTLPVFPVSARLADCSHRPPCPGCPRFGEVGPAKERVLAIAGLAQANGIEAQWVFGQRAGFRRRARLAVRGRAGKPKLGIFEAGTHRVVDIPECVIHHPVINEVAQAVRRVAKRRGTTSYSEQSGFGLLRGLQVAVEREHNRAQVVVIVNDTQIEASRGFLEGMVEELGEKLHSLWWNGNAESTNRILGDRFEHVLGEEFLVEEFGGAKIFLGPAAFGQNNSELFEAVVERVHGWVPRGASVVEYYAGAGTFGLGLLAKGASVAFNELHPGSLAGLAQGISSLPESSQARARVSGGAAGDYHALYSASDLVIVDPPRKGLDAGLLEGFAAAPPQKLIYVSCGFEAFEREVRALSGVLALTELWTYDLFAYTEHTETVALFERR